MSPIETRPMRARRVGLKRLLVLCSAFALGLGCSAEPTAQSIQGKITLAPQLESKLEPSDILWIYAFPASEDSNASESQKKRGKEELGKNPSPIVVKKVAPVSFPYRYILKEEEVMFPDRSFRGLVHIVAKLEKARLVENKKIYFEGVYKKNPVEVGSKEVNIVIDQAK